MLLNYFVFHVRFIQLNVATLILGDLIAIILGKPPW